MLRPDIECHSIPVGFWRVFFSDVDDLSKPHSDVYLNLDKNREAMLVVPD